MWGSSVGAREMGALPAAVRTPRVEDLGEAEQTSEEARFGVLDRAVEHLVVIEVEVDHVAPRIDRDRRDVVAEVGPARVDAEFGG